MSLEQFVERVETIRRRTECIRDLLTYDIHSDVKLSVLWLPPLHPHRDSYDNGNSIVCVQLLVNLLTAYY